MERGPHRPDRANGLTHESGVATWVTMLGVVVAVVIVAGGAWAITRGGSTDSTPSASGTPSQTPTSPPTDSPSASLSTSPITSGPDTSWSAACSKAAKTAIGAGFSVFGPAQLPDGWTLKGCRFRGGNAPAWTLRLGVDGKVVTLDQQRVTAGALVAVVLGPGAHRGAEVATHGTGTWQSWTTPDSLALSRTLASTAVVLSGSDKATLTKVAGNLLTYEDAPPGPGDDAGGGS